MMSDEASFSVFRVNGVVVVGHDSAGDLAGERRDAEPGLRDPLRRLQPHPELLRRSGQAQGRHGAARVPGILQALYFFIRKH